MAAEKAQESRGARGGATDVEGDTLKADIDAQRIELVNVVQSIKGLGTTAVAAAKREPRAAVDRLTWPSDREAVRFGHLR